MSWHHLTRTLSTTATLLLLGVSLAAAIALAQGAKFLSVQSGSMVPAFSKGDLVIVNSVPDNQYKVGDVITFINPNNNKQTISHRIQRILPKDNMQPQRFQTKGDANHAADAPIPARNIVGKVHFAIPYLGFLFDFAKKPAGLLLAIYVPALTVVIAEMKRLIKYYKSQEPYVATGYDPNKPAPKATPAKRFAKAGALATIAVVGVAAPTVHAALMSTATLASSSISSAPAGLDHPVISRVTFGSTSGSTTSNTNINITNNNSQTAASGDATGPGATSGNASNTNNTSVNITIGGPGSSSSSSNTPATVTVYNPTNNTISLSGWILTDNNSTRTLPNNASAPAKGTYVFTWPATNGLSRSGDRLVLGNPFTANVDSLSWGNDSAQLSPAIATTANTTILSRANPDTDTNAAADWQIL